MKKLFLFILGVIALLAGFIGLFLPIVPTVPFVLIAAACFAKSSETFHSWLMSNPLFGKYLRDHQEGRGVPRIFKVLSIAGVWVMTAISITQLKETRWKVISLVVAFIVTVYFLALRSRREDGKTNDKK